MHTVRHMCILPTVDKTIKLEINGNNACTVCLEQGLNLKMKTFNISASEGLSEFRFMVSLSNKLGNDNCPKLTKLYWVFLILLDFLEKIL